MIQVKSIQFSRQLTRQRGVANEYTSSRLLVVAVFKVHPLELVACLSVDRKVGFISVSCLPDNTLVLLHSLWPAALLLKQESSNYLNEGANNSSS